MIYKTINGTGLKVSHICLGTWIFGGKVDEGESIRMIEYAIEEGINFFDTADSYFDGAAEIILGKALKGRRNEIILAGKIGYRQPGDIPDLSSKHIRKAVESSLARLNTDYLDICYFHTPDYQVPFEESLTTIESFVKEGKIRYIGLSNFAAWQICKAYWLCAKNGFSFPVVTQNIYNPIIRGIEQELVPCCKDLGVGLTVYNPLAGGLLTGKYKRETKPAVGSRFDWNKKYYNRFWNDSYFDAVAALGKIGESAGKTMVELALQWLCQQEHVDSIVLGVSSIKQLKENLDAVKGRLNRDVIKAVDMIWRNLNKQNYSYNR